MTFNDEIPPIEHAERLYKQGVQMFLFLTSREADTPKAARNLREYAQALFTQAQFQLTRAMLEQLTGSGVEIANDLAVIRKAGAAPHEELLAALGHVLTALRDNTRTSGENISHLISAVEANGVYVADTISEQTRVLNEPLPDEVEVYADEDAIASDVIELLDRVEGRKPSAVSTNPTPGGYAKQSTTWGGEVMPILVLGRRDYAIRWLQQFPHDARLAVVASVSGGELMMIDANQKPAERLFRWPEITSAEVGRVGCEVRKFNYADWGVVDRVDRDNSDLVHVVWDSSGTSWENVNDLGVAIKKEFVI